MDDKTIFTTIGTVKRLYGAYKLQIITLAVLGFLSGIFESLGITMVIPLFSKIANMPLGNSNKIVIFFDWFFSVLHIQQRLRFILPLIVVFFVLRAIILFVFEYLRARIGADYETNNREQLYAESLQASWPYLLKQKVGHLENTLMIDINASTSLLSNLTNVMLHISSLAVYIAVAVSLSPLISFITLLIGAGLLLAFKPFIAKNKQYAKEIVSLNKRIAHDINENAIGAKTIKSLAVEGQIFKPVSKLFKRLREMKIKQAVVRSFTNGVIEPVSLMVIIMIFVIAFLRPGFNFAAFAVLVYMIQRIFIYVDRAQITLHGINTNIPYVQKAMSLKDELALQKEKNDGSKPFEFFGSIHFKDICFEYEEKNEVLDHIIFGVQKGEMLGITGQSGSGKTTIMDLILRLFSAKSGQILVDGRDVREIDLRDWRRHIGYVSQDVFLLNDTIENNIKFFDESIGDNDVCEAAKAAYVDEFVKNLPQGLKTNIGERGMQLSAGQRQRIALARMLVRKPQILVLDEATSSLDNESEMFIKKSIQTLKGKITILIVAHRLSTVMDCDRILVLKNGRIIEGGRPEELLKNTEGHFYHSYHAAS